MIHNDARWIFFNENWREKIFNHRFFVCSQQCSLPRIYVPFHLAESSQTFSRNTLEFRYSRGEKDCVIRTANNSGRQLLHAEQKGYDVCKRKLFPVKPDSFFERGSNDLYLRFFLPSSNFTNAFFNFESHFAQRKENRRNTKSVKNNTCHWKTS